MYYLIIDGNEAICWCYLLQRCSANHLCLALWPRCAVYNCAPASIPTEFLGLKLHFFTYKSIEFFFLCIVTMKAIFDC